MGRFFFALRPPADAFSRIAEVRPVARSGEREVDDERLHLTMFMLGDFASRPDALLTHAASAASATTLRPFHVTFDRLICGKGRVLLVPSETVLGLESFRLGLRDAMRRAGIEPPGWWRYGAHMTLLYGGGRAGGDRQIESIGWRAEDFVLVHSALGRTRHDILEQWPLG